MCVCEIFLQLMLYRIFVLSTNLLTNICRKAYCLVWYVDWIVQRVPKFDKWRVRSCEEVVFLWVIKEKLNLFYHYYILCVIFHIRCNWRFSKESKWQQISSGLQDFLRFLAHLNNALVWMVSILSLISSSPSFFSRPLGAFPRASSTISITVIFMLHSFYFL